MNINHILSPRAIHHRREEPIDQDSKLSRMMQLWPKNKVDPSSPVLRASRYLFDRKAVESSSLVWNDPVTLPPVLDGPPSPSRQAHRYSFNPPSLTKTSPHNHTKRTSWLPGLFHFKQPKVCSIECEARDEREAIGKLSQVLQEVKKKKHILCVFVSYFVYSVWMVLLLKDKNQTVEYVEREKCD